MSEFWLYFKLGLEHVLDWNAYDHVLFIIALCASYQLNAWKRLLWLVSLFTIGHTASLFITFMGWVMIAPKWVEFLIPVTIIVAAAYNILRSKREQQTKGALVLYLVTLFFGLIHGFGFGRYFIQINDENRFAPLLEFALGIEISQVIIVMVVMMIGYLLKGYFKISQRDWIMVVSSIIIGVAIPMLQENWIF